jgi:hypothetical protein
MGSTCCDTPKLGGDPSRGWHPQWHDRSIPIYEVRVRSRRSAHVIKNAVLQKCRSRWNARAAPQVSVFVLCTSKASKLSTSRVIVLRQMAPVRTAVDAPQQPRMPRTPGCVCQSSPILSPVFPIFHTRTKTSTQKNTAYAYSHKKNLCVSLSSPRTAESSRMLRT